MLTVVALACGEDPGSATTDEDRLADLVSMLRSVRAVGSESRWIPLGGSVNAPPILIGEMAVSGT